MCCVIGSLYMAHILLLNSSHESVAQKVRSKYGFAARRLSVEEHALSSRAVRLL
jgi:hypothetical protein